jgi:hypothetical protein
MNRRSLFLSTLVLCLSLPALVFGQAVSPLVPLDDLGPRPYAWGHFGGLYADGSNTMPPEHAAAGAGLARMIQPLDTQGNPSPDGRIVMLIVGSRNTARTVCNDLEAGCEPGSLTALAASDSRVNRAVTILTAGRTDIDPSVYRLPNFPIFDTIATSILAPAGVTEAQVQVAWLQLTHPAPIAPLPIQYADAYDLKRDISNTIDSMKVRYPNLRIAYLSSREYGGYATTTSGNPEPYAYETGFGNRWVIVGQIDQVRTGFNTDTARLGDLDYRTGKAPWLAWGPYLWANGTTPRQDGLTWQRDDFEADGQTLSAQGARKSASLLFRFLRLEPTAQPWLWSVSPQKARGARH